MKKFIAVLLVWVAVVLCCNFIKLDNTEEINRMNSETERTVYLEAVKDGTIRQDVDYRIVPSKKSKDGLVTQYELRIKHMFDWESIYVDVY